MVIASNFINTNNTINIELNENFSGFYAQITCSSIISPEVDELIETLSKINSRDKVRISIKSVEDETNILNYSNSSNINDFIEDISIRFEDEGEYVLSIDFVKGISNNIISIYDIKLFTEYLEKLSLESILSEFSRILSSDGKVFFDLINDTGINLSSSTIYFGSDINDFQINEFNRNRSLNDRSKICNFINSSKYKLSYLDFDFNCEVDRSNIRICEIFNKIKCMISLVSICDRSEVIDKNSIEYSLTGYKTINFNINYKSFIYTDNMKQYTEICEWLYKDDSKNLTDKVGIIRNIISISVIDNDITTIQSNLLASIKSSHEIYLRDNVEKYLQVKQEVSNNLFDLMKNVSQISDNVGDKLKNNIIGIVTFFISIIITNSLSDNRLKNIFTKDITIISIGFILFSIIYMKYIIKDSEEEIKRFEILYERTKGNYKGVLDDSDINNIFHDDKYLKEDISYINKKISNSKKIWILFIVIITLLIFLLGDFKFEYVMVPFKNLFNYTLGIIK